MQGMFAPEMKGSFGTFEKSLSDAGIPGIRYLDQGSRGKDEGTSNYVIFPGNGHLIEILKKYGWAPFLAASGADQQDSYPAGLSGQ